MYTNWGNDKICTINGKTFKVFTQDNSILDHYYSPEEAAEIRKKFEGKIIFFNPEDIIPADDDWMEGS